jgi:hypothetical protein
MAVFVFAEIIYMPNSKVYSYLIILQIIFIPLCFLFTQAFMYETVLSRDPWLHLYLTNVIIEQGRIPEYLEGSTDILPYLKMPNFHLVIAIFSIVTQLQYKISSLISIGVITLLLEILLIYLIGKSFYNEKIALLSALFLSISDNVLDMVGKNIVPNSIGVAIALFILYLVLTLKGEENVNKHIIIIISTFFLVATHTISYALVILQSVVLGSLAFFFKKNYYFRILQSYLILSFVIGVSYWMWISKASFQMIAIIYQAFVKYGTSEDVYMSAVNIPIFQILMSRLGMLIYFAISLIGIMWMVNNGRKCYYHVALGGICVTLIGIGVFSFLTPALSAIAHRFWYYGEVLCGIPVSIAFIIFYMKFNHRYRTFLTGAIAGSLVFLMLTASISNNDNPLTKSQSLRTGLYDSEISAADFVIFTNHDFPIASDYDYTQNILVIAEQKGVKLSPEFPRTLKEILNSDGYHFILRTKMLDRYFILGGMWNQNSMSLNEDQKIEFIKELTDVKSMFYNNGNVLIF